MVVAEGVAGWAVAGVEVGRLSSDLNSRFDVAVDGAVAVERLVSEGCGGAAVREPTRRTHVGWPSDLVGSGAYRAGRVVSRRWVAGSEPVAGCATPGADEPSDNEDKERSLHGLTLAGHKTSTHRGYPSTVPRDQRDVDGLVVSVGALHLC